MKKQLLSFLLTLPLAVNAQFSESFDSGIPSTWTVINGGDSGTWETYAGFDTTFNSPNSGAQFVGLKYGSTPHDDYLITPSFTVVAGLSDKLLLYGRNRGAGLAEVFDIKVSTTTPTAEAFTANIATDVKPPTTWTRYAYDLSAYEGQTIYIAFYSKTDDVWFLGLDDISVTNAASLSALDTVNKKFSYYPNPVKDFLTINYEGKLTSVSIYNFAGQLVKSINAKSINSKIDLSKLPTGNYILRVEENGQFKSFKIIKE